MLEVLVAVTFVVLIIGSITDLKTREVPDWLNFAAIIIAFGVRALYSLIEWTPTYVVEGIVGFVALFLLACMLYYLGQWGGGDSKMLMAMGALIGLQSDINHMMIGFIVNLLFVGGVYGLLWSIGLAIVHWKGIHHELHKLHQIKGIIHLKRITYVAALLIIGVSFLTAEMQWVVILLAVMVMGLFHLWLLIRAVEAKGMIKRRAVSKLTEGDWVVNEIRHNGKYICGPKDLGLTYRQISKLKKYHIRSVVIKEGIPFIPSFLLTYAVTFFWGNILTFFI